MDIKDITKTLLSASNVKAIAGKAGATGPQVKSVLSSALPSLLSGKETSAEEISKETGVSKAKTNGILSAAGPLLSGLLGGSQQQEEKPSGTAALLGSLLGTVNIGSLASGLMNLVSADNDEEEEEEEKPKKPKSGKKKTESSAKKPASGKKKTESSAKKPASGKKTSSAKKKDTKKEAKDSSPLGAVSDLLGGLFK